MTEILCKLLMFKLSKSKTYSLFVDHFCVQNSQRLYPPANHLPLWVGFGVLSIYALIISCIALILRVSVKSFM